MAGSAVIGTLRAILALDTAQFEEGTKKGKQAAKSFGDEMASIGKKFATAFVLTEVVGGLVNLGKEAFKASGQIVDLSQKTGLSIKTVQQFGFVAEQSGSSIEAMANATFKLGVNLEKGGKEVEVALKAIGLSLAEVQRLKPEDQFDVIARKLSVLPDIQQRNAIGVALMGKSYSEVAAPISEYNDLIDQATVTTDANVIAMDNAADAWDGFMNAVSATSRNVLGQVVIDAQTALSGWGKFFGEIKAFLSGSAKSHAEYVQQLQAQEQQTQKNITTDGQRSQSLDQLKEAEDKRTKALEAGRKAQEAYNKEVAALRGMLRGDDLAHKVKVLEDAFDGLTAEELQNAQVMKLVTAEAIRLADAGAKLRPDLDAIARSAQAVKAAMDLAKITTTDFGKALTGLGKEIDLVDPKFFKLEAMLAGAKDGGQDLIDKLKDLGTEVTLLPAPPTDGWLFFRDYATSVIRDISAAMAVGLTDMISGQASFKEAMTGIWHNIKSILLSILDDILAYFIREFLGKMIAAVLGSKLGNLIGNIIGGGAGVGGGGITPFMPGGFSPGVGGGAGVGGAAGAVIGVGSTVAILDTLVGALSPEGTGLIEGIIDNWRNPYTPEQTPAELARDMYNYQGNLYPGLIDFLNQHPDLRDQFPDVPSFANGGFIDAGTGTMAMLHGREFIVPEAEAMQSSGVTVILEQDGKKSAQWFAPYLADEVYRLRLA